MAIEYEYNKNHLSKTFCVGGMDLNVSLCLAYFKGGFLNWSFCFDELEKDGSMRYFEEDIMWIDFEPPDIFKDIVAFIGVDNINGMKNEILDRFRP